MSYFFATGIALGGRLWKDPQEQQPQQPLIVPQASCALSPAGGTCTMDTPKFSDNDSGISFQSARSEVSGVVKNVNGLNVYTTKASVTVNGLNIRDVLTADSIEGHIVSEYRVGDYEASTTIFGSQFGNLKIKGSAATLDLSSEIFHRYPTFSSMAYDFDNSYTKPLLLACLEGSKLDKGSAKTKDLRSAYYAYEEQEASAKLKPLVICSFVEKVNGLGGGATAWGPIISVAGFGDIYVGELMVWSYMRCLNMVRVELIPTKENPLGGSISIGTAGTGTGPPGNGP